MYKFELNEVVHHASVVKNNNVFRRPNPMVIIGRGIFETLTGTSEVNYVVSIQNDNNEKIFTRHILLECEIVKIESEIKP